MQGRILIVLVIFWGGGHFFGENQAQSPATRVQHAPRHQNFIGYVLGKLNPKDTDYGAQIESGRKAMVEGTVADLYFWSNAVTLVLLCGLTTFVLLEWRGAERREAIAASIIAQLWNGGVSDRIEIERRTEQFNRLVETHNREVEQRLSQKTKDNEEAETAGKLTRSVRNLRESESESPRAAARPPASADANLTSLQQDKLLLQRRVEALRNTEQNLKQRLNQTTVLLDQERRRNAALKGA